MSDTSGDLYKILGVGKAATDAEIRAAYKKLAVQFHPDRHVGDTSVNYEEKFKDIGEAFEVLSNEEKRRTYDHYGIDGLRKGKVYKPQAPRDIFEAFFGDRNPYAEFQPKPSPFPTQPAYAAASQSHQQPYTYPNAAHPPQPAPYPSQPHGYPPQSAPNYQYPNAQGYPPTQAYPPYPTAGYPPAQVPHSGYPPQAAAYAASPSPAPSTVPPSPHPLQKHAPIKKTLNCTLEELFSGTTKTFKHVRLVMRDGKPTSEPRELEVKLGAGWKGGSTVTFPGEGDESTGTQPGDLIVVVEEEPHALYKRDGNNLIHRAKITILDSLVGVSLSLKGLDGKDVTVVHEGVIEPNMIKLIPNEGFVSHSTGKRGDLIVEFELKFPKAVSAEQKASLKESALKDLQY